ncbi:DUF983 domain-containing protein [Phenylobacterium montanum]|uniref:DUF983 domain-containing protein n=1 Tax=Phenylobacterium montanum TaxID=2823693 RepID=A0A975G4I5_9CAUL|nr:DUF983 domain-containing protein [Caulobacter sp. S6]QUD90501.1 DUF983 domain-containing protein [Caulobacter sp. S6]
MSNGFDSPTSLSAGLRCRCPRCGEGRLFAGYLKLAKACDHCGLDYGFADPADGPAFFVTTGVSLLVIGVWLWAAVVYDPPVWLQFALVMPALIGGCLGTLRPVKAWMVAEQFTHKAGEGHWDDLGSHGVGGFTSDRRHAEVVNRPAAQWTDLAGPAG